MMTARSRILVAFPLLLALASCTSATKRYEQGQELEREGRPAEAADRYIQALEKDGRLDSARAGLRSSGVAAISEYLRGESLVDLTTVTGVDQAADDYVAIDALHGRALAVGVDLPLPPDYSVRRRAALDRAIGLNLSDARNLTSRGQFDAALDRLERASDRYQPAPIQQGELSDARADALIAWGRNDMASGAYRAAYDRVQPTFGLVGATQSQSEAARALQSEALRRGTRRVAVLAPRATPEASRLLPPEFLAALADAMHSEPWTRPPLFVDVVSFADIERALRGPRDNDRWLSPEDAILLGRVLRADYVVVAHIDSVRHDDVGVRSTRHAARTARGADTAYYVDEGQSRTTVIGTFNVVDASGRQRSEAKPFAASANGSFSHHRFSGDYQTLALSKDERDAFERPRSAESGPDQMRSLVAEVSRQFAATVFDEVLRRIP